MDKDIEENNDLGDAGKKALQSERDARKAADNARAVAEQALAEAQTKLQEATKAVEAKDAEWQGKVSEWETKFNEAEAKGKQDVESGQAENLKLRVALRNKIPEALLGSLTGSTEEELKASADGLKPYLATGAPAPDPTQGGAKFGEGDNLAGLEGRALMSESFNLD